MAKIYKTKGIIYLEDGIYKITVVDKSGNAAISIKFNQLEIDQSAEALLEQLNWKENGDQK